MRYKHKQLSDGIWAVFNGKKYFIDTCTHNEAEAKQKALEWSAQWYRDKMDEAHHKLEKMGVIDDTDPYGYLA